jgi:type II secretory pathway component PulK
MRSPVGYHRRFSNQQGSILIVTLWIVALLSLLAAGLASRSRLAIRQADWSDQELVAEDILRVMTELCVQRIRDDQNPDMDAYSEPWGRPFTLTGDELTVKFGVVSPMLEEVTVTITPIDESGKLNINYWAPLPEIIENCIQQINADVNPQLLTEAIVDWWDADSNGAMENDVYQSNVPAYSAMNGELRYLHELLFVKGVTPLLYWGEDTNHNQLLDPAEDDGDLFLPRDNEDGQLQFGLADVFTVYGNEQTNYSLNINSVSEPVLKAVLLLGFTDADASKISTTLLNHRRGKDNLDGTNDDAPFGSVQELETILDAAVYQRFINLPPDWDVISTAYRFYIQVHFDSIPIVKHGTIVILKNEGKIELAEWIEG